MNFINQLLENLNEGKFVFHLQAIFQDNSFKKWLKNNDMEM